MLDQPEAGMNYTFSEEVWIMASAIAPNRVVQGSLKS